MGDIFGTAFNARSYFEPQFGFSCLWRNPTADKGTEFAKIGEFFNQELFTRAGFVAASGTAGKVTCPFDIGWQNG